MKRTIWIGYDPREGDAYEVARRSAKARMAWDIPAAPLMLDHCQRVGAYRRPTERRDGRLWDVISGAPMATEFAISRFLIPHFAGRNGWALFVDCDVMFRADPHDLFDLADERYAVMCVKHSHVPRESTKMDGQAQLAYPRKNWSSVMLLNLGHSAMRDGLTVETVNTLPGRDLHGFRWLADRLIGELPSRWNHLVGVDEPREDAACVHFTLGVPSMPGYESCEYADEWRSWLRLSQKARVGGLE